LVNEGFNEAAAYTTIVPEACWEDDGDPEDAEGDFELHATEPASNPATSIVDTEPARTPIRDMGQNPSRVVMPNSYEKHPRVAAIKISLNNYCPVTSSSIDAVTR